MVTTTWPRLVDDDHRHDEKGGHEHCRVRATRQL
jgi:hypothetical protein